MMEIPEGGEVCFPQLLNTSCRKAKRSHSEAVLIYIVLSFISLLTVILNLLVIVSITHFKQLHSTTNLLLLSLAVSDFLVGFMMVFQILVTDGCWFLGDSMCTIYQFVACVITSVSIGDMVLISIDRYVAICDPLHYSTRFTLKRVQICIGLCWICSVLSHVFTLTENLEQQGMHVSCKGECVVAINYIVGFLDLILSFIGPVTAIVSLYMRVFVVAVSQARAMRSHVTAVTRRRSGKAQKSELKAARTLGVVVVVFLMCICPYYCVALAGEDTLISASSAAFVMWLIHSNSCLNPLIYAFFYRWFRKSIKLIVTLEILQPHSSKISIL